MRIAGTPAIRAARHAARMAAWAIGLCAIAAADHAAAAPPATRPALTVYAGDPAEKGDSDGTTAAARFYAPGGVAADRAGNLYVADSGNQTIRRITPAGAVTTLAGARGERGSQDGPGAAARFDVPSGICIDGEGNLYVSDTYGSTIRRISAAGAVSTLAGGAGERGSADGQGTAARFSLPQGVAVDDTRNVYVADTYNHTIRMISPGGAVTTLAGLAGAAGAADGRGAEARFNLPSGIAVGADGNLYVADQGNSLIRVVTRAGMVRTLAGTAGAPGAADGAGGKARFREPFGIARGRAGDLYVTDTGNHRLRVVTPRGAVRTLITGPAGGAASDRRPARLSYPGGLAAPPSGRGTLFLTDGNAIFEVD